MERVAAVVWPEVRCKGYWNQRERAVLRVAGGWPSLCGDRWSWVGPQFRRS